MKSFIVASALVSVAVAQSATSTANPFVPTGISSGCSSFLTSMNSDKTISPCITPLVSATSAFAPSSNTSKPSASTVSSALNSLCGASSSCDASAVRTALSNFYSACTPELTSSKNADVLKTYDVLYALVPLTQAVCAKDDSGRYCATEAPSSSSSASAAGPSGVSNNIAITGGSLLSDVTKYLYVGGSNLGKRADAAQQPLSPNTTTWAQSNILFMFLQPSLDTASLCTSCARQILTSYITFESQQPYAPGLSNSALLSGQSALYSGVQSKCGSSFLSGAVQAAGGIGSGVMGSNGAAASMSTDFAPVATVLMGALSLLFAAL